MDQETTLKENIRKGTTTVGIHCADGIVLAADNRVTLGGRFIVIKDEKKVFPITDNMVITTAGNASDLQLITKLIRSELMLRRMRTRKENTVKETVNLLGTIVYQNIRRFSAIPGITGFLLGGVDHEGFHLYQVSPDGTVSSYDEFVPDGAGMMMAFGVLDTLYQKGIKVNEGIKLAVKAINAAIQRDTATGDGVDVYTITKQGVKKVLTKKLDSKLKVD